MRIPIYLFLLIVMLATLHCQSVKDQAAKLHSGLPGNDLRIRLGVPVIDTAMVKLEYPDFIGFEGEERWESRERIPVGESVLHEWKNVRAYDEENKSIEEADGLRIRINDSVGQGLNIVSIIKQGSTVVRSGKLFTYSLQHPNNDRLTSPFRLLNAVQVDSVLESWKLNSLIRVN